MQRVTHASAKAFLIRKFQTLLGSALNASAYTDMEFPKIWGTLFGILIARILLFRVLYKGPLFSETPTSPHCDPA